MSPSAFGDPDFKDLDMRQQLARAIYNCVWGAPPYTEAALPAPVDTNPHDVPWLRAADECIRQMEWARTLHGEQWRGDGRDRTRYLVDLDNEPLTLAPGDWKS
jgi:hypothetical protein